ncbi:HAD family phosphatase [Flavobacteriaceae bacterium F89]|uniref:HAD family phosphatase n=1 Tax=Cerina litoralis TaxID=2874477 RepID=A0AAE3EV53_9FLAO|nr:HAD family phosphatase [Cerina litoralis]MCG2461095.1 HAD family phosphatase [Cerina litoralis]
MVKNIIFDFGDIFVNLDKPVILREMEKYKCLDALPQLESLNSKYEIGLISSEEFIAGLHKLIPQATPEQLTDSWNAMLLDFPDHRLGFIEGLANEGKYRLFLLSNTNALHIPHVAQKMGLEKFERFKNCFEQFYLSHEIQLRKPHLDIYKFVLENNGLKPEETFFVDDTKANTEAAESLGIKTWNLLVGQEDVVQLLSKLP